MWILIVFFASVLYVAAILACFVENVRSCVTDWEYRRFWDVSPKFTIVATIFILSFSAAIALFEPAVLILNHVSRWIRAIFKV